MEELERLLAELKSADATDRRYAAEDLEELGDPLAAPELIAALNDPVVAVREAAAQALSSIGGAEVSARVAGLLESEDVAGRNFAQEILANIGVSAVDVLCDTLKHPSPDVRKFALDVIGKIGEINRIENISRVVALFDDENINVAAAAVEAVGRIGDGSAIGEMMARFHRHPWMQCNILYALSQIGGEAATEAVRNIDPATISDEARPYHQVAMRMLGIS